MADLRAAIRTSAARRLLAGGLIALAAAISPAHSDPLRIVAAENVYGDVARQIGGAEVKVTRKMVPAPPGPSVVVVP